MPEIPVSAVLRKWFHRGNSPVSPRDLNAANWKPPFGQPCDEAVIRSSPVTLPCSKAAAPWILAATILGSSLAFIDSSVVNLALPALQTNFNATVVDAQWVVEAYALLLTALMLVGGSLGDIYGRKRIYIEIGRASCRERV